MKSIIKEQDTIISYIKEYCQADNQKRLERRVIDGEREHFLVPYDRIKQEIDDYMASYRVVVKGSYINGYYVSSILHHKETDSPLKEIVENKEGLFHVKQCIKEEMEKEAIREYGQPVRYIKYGRVLQQWVWRLSDYIDEMEKVLSKHKTKSKKQEAREEREKAVMIKNIDCRERWDEGLYYNDGTVCVSQGAWEMSLYVWGKACSKWANGNRGQKAMQEHMLSVQDFNKAIEKRNKEQGEREGNIVAQYLKPLYFCHETLKGFTFVMAEHIDNEKENGEYDYVNSDDYRDIAYGEVLSLGKNINITKKMYKEIREKHHRFTIVAQGDNYYIGCMTGFNNGTVLKHSYIDILKILDTKE